MNEYELREAIKARIALRPPTGALCDYAECQKCNAPLEWLYVGGVGDWMQTITCERCFVVRRGVPFRQVIVPLVAAQYGYPEGEALARLEGAQADYVASLASTVEEG